MCFLRLDQLREFHSAYLSSLGRAIAVCQHFEDCGRHVATVSAVTEPNVRGLRHERLREIALRVSGAPFGRALQQLGATGDFKADDYEIVERGREARNWFAHEAAECIAIPADSLAADVDRMRVLHERVRALCAAATIVAIGSYEICERERAPERYVTNYKHDLQRWIFEPMIGWVGWLTRA